MYHCTLLRLMFVTACLLVACTNTAQTGRKASTSAPAAPTAMPEGTPQNVPGPTFVVNSLPVGCHESPSADAPIAVQRSPGTVQAMDLVIRQSDGVWHREVDRQCWTRTNPGPVQVFDTLAKAEDHSAAVRRIEIRQARQIGSLELEIESAEMRADPEQVGRWQLILALRLTNRGNGDYDYDLSKSLKLQPGDHPPDASNPRTPALTRGKLKSGASQLGFVSFVVREDQQFSAVRFSALKGLNAGTIRLMIRMENDRSIVRITPTPTPDPRLASYKTEVIVFGELWSKQLDKLMRMLSNPTLTPTWKAEWLAEIDRMRGMIVAGRQIKPPACAETAHREFLAALDLYDQALPLFQSGTVRLSQQDITQGASLFADGNRRIEDATHLLSSAPC